jgi:hypothetical protein
MQKLLFFRLLQESARQPNPRFQRIERRLLNPPSSPDCRLSLRATGAHLARQTAGALMTASKSDLRFVQFT